VRRRRVEGGGLKGRRRIGGVVEVGYRRDVRGVDVGRGRAEGLFFVFTCRAIRRGGRGGRLTGGRRAANDTTTFFFVLLWISLDFVSSPDLMRCFLFQNK
jgi:hypothetical protein